VASEKKINNELVSDDDQTAELEVIALRREHLSSVAAPLERDERTSDLEDTGNLDKKIGEDAQILSKLQYDIEQLRARSMGLEAENKAREEVTVTLTEELNGIRNSLATKNDLLASRNEEIESLKSALRKQEAQHLAAAARQEQEAANMRKALQSIPNSLRLAPAVADGADDQNRYERIEGYADSLRHKLQDLMSLNGNLEREQERLAASLRQSNKNRQQLAAELAKATQDRDALAKELKSITDKHAEETRMLRLELGEAQNTVAQNEELNSQLASDLVDARVFKEELEQMLCDSDAISRARIDKLEKELVKTQWVTKDLEEKLKARGDAINVMLAELAGDPKRLESISEIGDVIACVDKRIAEQFDEATDHPTTGHRTNDRVTRVLIGKAGDKLLQFPLFKDRLTIGRSEDNDIHLNSAFISRRHAVVQTDGDATRVIDWGSRNGVFVNSKRITEHFLKNGDIVTVGNVHFRYDERPKRDN
jgi:chromosome segregation ATPase